jgi:two-component system, chemotaxis family, protein-glutamate methylesterase/glutaminase
MIKVFIIDDSMLIRNFIKKLLKNVEDIEIIGEASDPIEALNQFSQIGLPDVFILDLEMPKMHGLEFLEKLKQECPIPTVIFASLDSNQSTNAIKALELGASDIVLKPSNFTKIDMNEFSNNFVSTIKAAHSSKEISILKENKIFLRKDGSDINKVIAIGASTGGVQTLEMILTKLEANHPPILIVIHMPEGFTTSFAKRLNSLCKNSLVKEAEDNENIKAGMIFIAPGNLHLEVKKIKNKGYVTSLKDYPKVSNHKPSIDVLFSSFSEIVKEDSVAFILTGMGKDGVEGIGKIKEIGGKTYGQDEKSSIVYGMSKVAFDTNSVEFQVSIFEIITIINNIGKYNEKNTSCR